MNDQRELDWLTRERPLPLPLDPGTTARVRGSLMAHATGASRRPGSRKQRGFASGLGMRVAVLRTAGATLALAGAGAVALLAIGSGGSGVALRGHPQAGSGLAASSAPLTRLSVRLADDAAPLGNATLVLRRQVYPSSPEIDGADLYADNGDYYYSPAASGLPAMIKAGQTVNQGSADQEQRDIAAAKSALAEPLGQAREQMSVAGYAPGTNETTISPAAARKKLLDAAPPADRQKLQRMFAQQAAADIQPAMSREDEMIWDNGMDALLAGAGDPQVRAGVLKLFATVPEITVASGTLNGRQTLDLTASVLSSKAGIYQEQLVLDANTGVPLEMIGGNQGQTPDVTVFYTITRTTVAAVANGTSAGS